MPHLSIHSLGRKLAEARGDRGIRQVAREIGVSPATLSRIERGYLPDIETFTKVCKWLHVDPGQVLGVVPAAESAPKVAVHFRKDVALAPATAQALAQMVLAAHRAWLASEAER
jgi:transcriptional regulator with XRE-family HTH domain